MGMRRMRVVRVVRVVAMRVVPVWAVPVRPVPMPMIAGQVRHRYWVIAGHVVFLGYRSQDKSAIGGDASQELQELQG